MKKVYVPQSVGFVFLLQYRFVEAECNMYTNRIVAHKMNNLIGILCLFALAHCMAMCPSDYGIVGVSISEQQRCLSIVPIEMASISWNVNWHTTADKICSSLFDSGKLASLSRFPRLSLAFKNVAKSNGRAIFGGGCASKRNSLKKRPPLISNDSSVLFNKGSYFECSGRKAASTHYRRMIVASFDKVKMGLRNVEDQYVFFCAYYEFGNAEGIPKYFSCTNRTFPVDYVVCEHSSLQTACIEWDKQGKKCGRCAPGRQGPFCATYGETHEQRSRRSMTDFNYVLHIYFHKTL
ncbi:hypothetical protein D918_09613 [Trichuris suis]|nr:hypothetical protein D918_09613 [Trichuris suis]